MSRRIALVLALVSIAACASESPRSIAARPDSHLPAMPVMPVPVTEAASGAVVQAASAQPSARTNVARPREVVRTADVRLRAARPAAVVDAARRWAEAHGGYVDDANTGGAAGSSVASRATLRVPASQYAESLTRFRALATVLEVNEHGEDVTLAHADAEARLAAKRALEQRLVALTEHAATVAELIQVENELGRVRADIESMEATQRALRDRVAFATITLSVEAPEQPLVARAESFGSRLGRSFAEGVRAAELVVTGTVRLATALSPIVGLMLLVWGAYRLAARGRGRGRAASARLAPGATAS